MWRKLAAHPLTPLVLGVLLMLSSPGDVIPKSYFLLALWLWFCVDLFSWLELRWNRWRAREEKTQLRNGITYCAVICFVAVLMLFLDRAILGQWLEALQGDTLLHLAATATLPPDGNPLATLFSVVNNGSNKIAKHTITCHVHTIAAFDDKGKFFGMDDLSFIVSRSDAPLESGGDSQSDQCLSGFTLPPGIRPKCLDLTVGFTYSLEVEKELTREKLFRFVGIGNAARFVWIREPEQSQSYCAEYAPR